MRRWMAFDSTVGRQYDVGNTIGNLGLAEG
jgi:hypothetical protein